MEVLTEDALEQEIASSPESFRKFLEAQRELLHSQIDQLQNVVVMQCKLTGVNPLSQEMAAGALSIKIGKRPRDLLNPKAVKYMQSVFAIKDAISKKESREISARFGVKIIQVRDFFASQRTRVRKFIRISREKAVRSEVGKVAYANVPPNSESNALVNPVPLSTIGPSNMEEARSSMLQSDVLSNTNELDKHFVNNIFNLMGREETFSGQVKLMKWILQIQNIAVLSWFLTKGGVMIIATWLSQAATEEQTTVLYMILEVLCHLPIHEAVPTHVSAILQSVNSLRFYQVSDVSNRAKALLAKWSKMFARAQSIKKPNGMKSSDAALKERAWSQSLSEILGDEAWHSNTNASEGILAPYEGSENMRKLGSSPPLKLLTASSDDSNRKQIVGLSSSQTKVRRKVQFVEQPGQKLASRVPQVSKQGPALANRPITVDDIKKAKLRASYMQNKYGKRALPSLGKEEMKNESELKPSTSDPSNLSPVLKGELQPKLEEQKINVVDPAKIPTKPDSPLEPKLDLSKPRLVECKRSMIPWKAPSEVRLSDLWRVGCGEDSKEVDAQRNRNRREKETIYMTAQEIPPNPKEPWDHEMDYDDSLTPLIPIEQLPDADADAMETSEENINRTLASTCTTLASSALSVPQGASSVAAEPDLELLAVLLKNPSLVFALTSGQAGNFTGEDTVKVLDMIKSGGISNMNGTAGGGVRKEERVEVSLPSPTPSSDPGTNPFSQQRQMSNRVMTQTPTVPNPNTMLHQQLTNLQQLLQMQQQIQPAAVPSVVQQQQSSFRQTAETSARSSMSIPGFQNIPSGSTPVAATATVMPDGLYTSRAQPHHLYSDPVVQKHHQLYHSSSPAGQPISGSNSWRDGSGFHHNSYPHNLGHQAANFNTSYDGRMWDGNTRAGSGRYPDGVPNPAGAYRSERQAQRDSSSGYWDTSRHGERWQRDRRY
ncbi:hypothetical protein SAY87_025176 [Trapa incisa]|uniref:Homeobox domain-containing protein n=1 Tax=Trapa incisa TaxID=236973 RepID=A0AAN7GL28_9MYRT|nr:hypothetical protein SAY87_025176 [Trapa incisa]